jgi:hypothetical protein
MVLCVPLLLRRPSFSGGVDLILRVVDLIICVAHSSCISKVVRLATPNEPLVLFLPRPHEIPNFLMSITIRSHTQNQIMCELPLPYQSSA